MKGRLLETVRILNVESRLEETRVYNFEIDDFHTYAVGELETLVHNNSWDIDGFIDHIIDGNHFPGKSREEIKSLLEITKKNGKEIPDPGGVEGRAIIHDKSTDIIILFDGKGGGTMFRPDKPKQWILDWKKNQK